MRRLLPIILLTLTSALQAAPGDFRTDVMAVLSKAGCNLGGCHGNGSGKGGFKLSLRGQDPDLDWLALTREQGGRRVNPLEPEKSLLLLKATGAIAHEGGQRFNPASPEYAALLAWLRDGAPDSAGPRLTRLEVTPTERVLIEPERSIQLRAVAHFADGTSRDVTRLAVFEPNNTLTRASSDGVITRERAGETTVLVRFLERQVPVHLAFVPARADFAWSEPPATNFIDEHIFQKLRTLRIAPSELCSDTVFLRRVYLDLLGIGPTAGEARDFLADRSADKRARLVETLFARPEFADFWALKWADLLKIEERLLDPKGMQVFHGWIRSGIAANKPLDQFARELIAARGSTYENPPANWWRANRDATTRAENTARIFLGTQLNCARCHNHPFERWTQDDYYNWSALFARVDYKIVENNRKDKNDQQEFKGDQIVRLKAGGEPILNPRTNEPAVPRFLGGEAPRLAADRDELQALSEWLVQSPMFARMQVNRVWFHLLGRGLVDPVDDFRASNPPSHPALLDALAGDFARRGFDLRHLIRTIVASRTYQLAAEPNATNADDEANFARGIVRRLSAEQILDSMSQVLDAPLTFEDHPNARRFAQVPEGRRHYRPIKADLDRFALDFGKPPRLIASDCERSNETTLPQAFQLLSGPLPQQLLTRPGNRLGQLLVPAGDANVPDASAVLDSLYWTALSRPPSAAEQEKMSAHLTAAREPRRALEDVAWALLNSKEFLFRH